MASTTESKPSWGKTWFRSRWFRSRTYTRSRQKRQPSKRWFSRRATLNIVITTILLTLTIAAILSSIWRQEQDASLFATSAYVATTRSETQAQSMPVEAVAFIRATDTPTATPFPTATAAPTVQPTNSQVPTFTTAPTALEVTPVSVTPSPVSAESSDNAPPIRVDRNRNASTNATNNSLNRALIADPAPGCCLNGFSGRLDAGAALLPTAATEAPEEQVHEQLSFTSTASPDGPNCRFYHTVRRGDTLSGLSLRYDKSMRSLSATNGITHYDAIYVDQVLCIP